MQPGLVPTAPATAEGAVMWALGVVAFELLTNEPLFAPGTLPQDIRQHWLAGRPCRGRESSCDHLPALTGDFLQSF